MFFLARLISTSCRSLAAMIGFARKGGGGRLGRSGSPDDWMVTVRLLAFRLPPASAPASQALQYRRPRRRRFP
jgi:hypothetical protein